MNIPEAMIQAAADVVLALRDQATVTRVAREALTAALATCTVREEWRIRCVEPGGRVTSYASWTEDRDEAEVWLTWQLNNRPHRATDLEHRLIIETEPVAIPQPERTTP